MGPVRVALLVMVSVAAFSLLGRGDAAVARSAPSVDPLVRALAWRAEGDQDNASFGWSVAAGDVNGDGFDDVIVGDPDHDSDQGEEGRAYVYHGSGSGLPRTPAWTAESDQDLASFGWSVATAGDVNGDGFDDVIVGAFHYDSGRKEGAGFVYHGSASGLSLTPDWTAQGDQGSAAFGWSVGTAGDVNGDGFDDVIVGEPWYDIDQMLTGRAFVYHGSASGLSLTPAWTAGGDHADEQFGRSVGAAGDVNGDGFGDVIVGAPDIGGGTEGWAFLYQGSASGLSFNPAWTAEGDEPVDDFGSSVGAAGDVNGDGFGDVVVGAPGFDQGGAFLYEGSASGLSTTPAWVAYGDQAFVNFGTSVGTAGDVNRDGFDDVIVGVPGYNAAGRADIYPGSASGLSLDPRWKVDGHQKNAGLGTSVGAAGDVNGDRIGDVIVGAPDFRHGELGEGAAFVFLGAGIRAMA